MSSPASATTRALNVPELLLEILPNLSRLDLLQTSRVSKHWRTQSQIVLYHTVDLMTDFCNPYSGWAQTWEQASLLRRTLESRPRLGQHVRELRLITDGPEEARLMRQGNSPPTDAEQPVRVLELCTCLRELIVGGFSPACVKTVTASATLPARLTKLEVHVCSAVGAHLTFDDFAPALARLPHLTSLHLDGWPLPPQSTSAWPKLTCQLKTLTLEIKYSQPEPPTAADVDWFVHSSRGSLRHLTLADCGRDAFLDVLEWGHSLRSFHVSICEDHLDGDTSVIERLARLGSLHKLRVVVFQRRGPEASGAEAIRAAAQQVNRQLGREVVKVAQHDWLT